MSQYDYSLHNAIAANSLEKMLCDGEIIINLDQFNPV